MPPSAPTCAPAPATNRRWPTLIVAPALAVVTFLAFLPALNAAFSDLDDHALILDAEGYRGLAVHNFAWMFRTTLLGHFQPLTWLSYAIDYTLWGLNPRAFHVVNVAIHAVNASLLYMVTLRLLTLRTGEPTDPEPHSEPWFISAAAAAGTLLWSIHPLRVESVAWVTERRDVLSMLLLLLTTLAYLRAFPLQSVRPRSLGWYLASIALLLLSVLAKGWGMTYFAVLIALDWYPLRRLPFDPRRWFAAPARAVLLQKIPFALVGLFSASQAARAASAYHGVAKTMTEWGVVERFSQACYGTAFYLGKLLWPTGLAAVYELPKTASPAEPRFLIGIIATLSLGLAAIALVRRLPAFTVAAAIYVMILAPTLGIFQSGIQLVADRYAYVASTAWSILLSAGLVVLARRARPLAIAGIGAMALALVALSVATWRQTTVWRNTETLFVHAIAVGADGAFVRDAYGRQLRTQGRLDEALRQFDLALERDPTFGEPWLSRGEVLNQLGRYAEAEQAYLKARQYLPDPFNAELALGTLYFERLDRFADARATLESAVRRMEAPGAGTGSPRAYILLAGVLDVYGEDAACREMLERAAAYPQTRDEALAHLRDLDAGH